MWGDWYLGYASHYLQDVGNLWHTSTNIVQQLSTHGGYETWVDNNWDEGHNLYEAPNIIINGQNGFISDDIDELRNYIQELFDNDKLAKSISIESRKTFIDLFGKTKIKENWKNFLER